MGDEPERLPKSRTKSERKTKDFEIKRATVAAATEEGGKKRSKEVDPATENAALALERNKESKRLWGNLKKIVNERKLEGKLARNAPSSYKKSAESSKYSNSSKSSYKRYSSEEEDRSSYDETDLEEEYYGEMETGDESEEVEFKSKKDSELVRRAEIRSMALNEMWDKISYEVKTVFDKPSRVYNFRGYHSEPDLPIPFEKKFSMNRKSHHKLKGDKSHGLKRAKEKFVSLEDILLLSGKEHPDLIRGSQTEIRLKTMGIDDNLKCLWLEIAELEKKRFSFFDELFAMGYIVDSLEVPAPNPKSDRGGEHEEYFVEADKKHYKKKVDYGRAVFKTKHVYTGSFQDWYFEGAGKYCWENGTVYQGEFSGGVMHGPGRIHWPDTSIYEGHFIDGIRTGWGVYSSPESQTYAGEWLDGLPHGLGKMWYDPEDDDNDYYEGQLEKGLPQGVGTRQYSTGDRYIGSWVQGLRNGYGIMIWLQERQVYKGNWLEGAPHGFGKHIWYLERTPSNSFPTRHVYTGQWTQGRREGVGKMIYPCGSIYDGGWKNGQRHGKGMFINPAGDILVGIFRAGAICGGSGVPLHAPTYECDYGGLVEWLTAKFKLTVQEGSTEEDIIQAITKQYLPYIRQLYHRAGEYSQKYGNHGLYPSFMKKFDQKENHHHDHHRLHRQYSRSNEPEHMKAKPEKPESLDGINPVTRFGLWLLIKDCDNLLDEVTMAFYDKIWSDTPPLSFQTVHNPFEPVYLWQFLQALIVAAVAYYVEIPRRRPRLIPKEDKLEDVAVSETTLNAGISYEEHKRLMLVRQLRSRTKKLSTESEIVHVPEPASSTLRKGKGKSHKDLAKKRQTTMQPKQLLDVGDGDGKKGGGSELRRSKDDKTKSKTRAKSTSTKAKSKAKSKADESILTKDKEYADSKSKKAVSNSKKSDAIHRTSLQMEDFDEDEIEYFEELAGEDSLLLEEEGIYKKSVAWPTEPEEAEELLNQVLLPPPSISECFETFLVSKLLPCLKRESGANLPMVPQPLPALVDMYEAFKVIEDRDVLTGPEFLRSTLPHMRFPTGSTPLWWHRCSEPLSAKMDFDDLLRMYKKKFSQSNTTGNGKLVEDLFATAEKNGNTGTYQYLGPQAQSSTAALKLLNLEDNTADDPDCNPKQVGRSLSTAIAAIEGGLFKRCDSEDTLTDFVAEGNPFGEEELAPEPFLWADDYKCIPAPRSNKHFGNISTMDVFDAFRQLYPRLCDGSRDKDLNFELIFCDWLWCTSFLAKISAEKEFREAWKTETLKKVPTNPQSLGVYAHYIKQIKHNPYLAPSPTLSPEFHAKLAQFDERKGVVTFSM